MSTLDEKINKVVDFAEQRIEDGAVIAPQKNATVADVNLILLRRILRLLESSGNQALATQIEQPTTLDEEPPAASKKRGRKKAKK